MKWACPKTTAHVGGGAEGAWGRVWLSGEKDIAAAARRLVAKSRRLGGAGRAYLAIFAPRCVPIEGASTS